MIHARHSVTIHRDRDEVYRYWRDLDRLPTFMIHLDSVRQQDDRRSHWVACAPAGRHVEWDAEIVEDRPGELIQWTSVAGSEVSNGGQQGRRLRGTDDVVSGRMLRAAVWRARATMA